MAWYKKSFGKEYLSVYGRRNDEEASREIDFVLSVLKPPRDAWILDLACGAGRHARALAGRGMKNVVGIDLSPELLSVAARDAERLNSPHMLLRGDMRRIPFRARFDIVLSMFTSFGYFENDWEDALVARGAARALKPGGMVVLDLPNRDYVEANLVPESVSANNGEVVTQSRRMNGRRVEKRIIIKKEGRGGEKREFVESVRLYTLEEIEALLGAEGLRIEQCRGDFDGGAMTASSPRMILFGRRADEN